MLKNDQPMSFGERFADLARHPYTRYVSVAVLSISVAMLSWFLFKIASLPVQTNRVQAAPVVHAADARLMAENIAQSHLFGQDASQAVTPAVSQVANIQVQGLLYSDDQTSALAILEIDGKTGTFKAGDMLPDGETLNAIGMTAVQIANGSIRRVIELQRDRGGGSDILLASVEGLPSARNLFPEVNPLNTGPVVVQRLQPVDVGIRGNPIAKMRALRQKLIKH